MDDKVPMQGEPTFVLMARDPNAPGLVRAWADEREDAVARGERPEADRERVQNARDVARAMEAWRDANDGAWREANPSLPGVMVIGDDFVDVGAVSPASVEAPRLFTADEIASQYEKQSSYENQRAAHKAALAANLIAEREISHIKATFGPDGAANPI